MTGWFLRINGNVDDGWLIMDREGDGFESRNEIEQAIVGCGYALDGVIGLERHHGFFFLDMDCFVVVDCYGFAGSGDDGYYDTDSVGVGAGVVTETEAYLLRSEGIIYIAIYRTLFGVVLVFVYEF